MRVSIFVLLFNIFPWIEESQAINESGRTKSGVTHNGSPEFVGGASHPCYRKCTVGDSRTCKYTFTLAQYTTMNMACRKCPVNKDDCFRKGCITAGGDVRSITVANHMLPGPSVQVCEGDRIQVTVNSDFDSEATTIHWHGMQQIASPFMDGVPFVTQCPVPPHNSFKYDFVASPAGTQIWHSHIGYQEYDGLYGILIVRKPEDPLDTYYDYDLAEHVMIVWQWFNASTAYLLGMTPGHSLIPGHGLLINGLAAKAEIFVNDTIYKTPRAVFEVDSGKRYRFRTIFNSAVYCPVQVSIDDHTLLVIASDVGTFQPVPVDSFVINAGERYDFLLNANKTSGNYWIRFRGVAGGCKTKGSHVSEVAVLRYKNSSDEDPPGTTNYDDANRSGILLNPVELASNSFPNNTVLILTDLNGTTPNRPDVSGTPDYTYYFKLSFNAYDTVYPPGLYPQINDVSFKSSRFPFLTEGDALTSDMYCTESDNTAKECVNGFCSCPFIYRVAKDSLVEIVFFENSMDNTADHPMHLHGYEFRVVAMLPLEMNSTMDDVKAANEAGLISKKFDTAPTKDCVSVPSRSVTILRFIASNPGYWLFHCHIGEHNMSGMAFIIKVGEDDEMIRPSSDFPRCSGFKNCKRT